ncbi:MAG: hypothetical protein V1787_06600 [Candidatus Micrarchaeota archaeon]
MADLRLQRDALQRIVDASGELARSPIRFARAKGGFARRVPARAHEERFSRVQQAIDGFFRKFPNLTERERDVLVYNFSNSFFRRNPSSSRWPTPAASKRMAGHFLRLANASRRRETLALVEAVAAHNIPPIASPRRGSVTLEGYPHNIPLEFYRDRKRLNMHLIDLSEHPGNWPFLVRMIQRHLVLPFHEELHGRRASSSGAIVYDQRVSPENLRRVGRSLARLSGLRIVGGRVKTLLESPPQDFFQGWT